MYSRIFAALVSFALAAPASAAAGARPDVIAIYYPHWHAYPKGNEWFGADNWKQGEWAFVKSSPPRFPGHRQPLVPKCGYFDGKNPRDVAVEIDFAAEAGIDVFLYDYYWYGGKITQEEALEEGFLKAPNRGLMKFAIMWCYHDRADQFRPPADTKERRMLMKLDRTPDEFLGLMDHCIKKYFPQKEYYRKGGALYFSFYNPAGFISSVGGEKARAAIAEARRRVRAAGLGEIHFNGQGGRIENTEEMRDIGFDSLTDYAFGVYGVHDYKEKTAAGEWRFDFGSIGPDLEKLWRKKESGPLPYYPLVPTGWDTSARMRPDVKMPLSPDMAEYPYTGCFTNATAEVFGRYLRMARDFAAESPSRDIVQINAWNEYTEGCWLVPDNFEGDAKLREIEKTFGRKDAPLRKGPVTSEEKFFRECLDTSIPELSAIPALVGKGDVAGAEKVFAAYVRRALDPEKFLSRERASDAARSAKDVKRVESEAKDAMDFRFTVCRTPYRFEGGKIDWTFNPTWNGYEEWTWQFSRHEFFYALAEYYRRTGDERAARAWRDITSSWIDQALLPPDGTRGTATKCWRTIDTGMRMSGWPVYLHTFLRSPACDDRFLTRFFISVWEHGHRLTNVKTRFNWRIHELSGLVSAAAAFPFFRDSGKWIEAAGRDLEEELSSQVYPDGFQCELSTGYHYVVINNIMQALDAYDRAGIAPPPGIAARMKSLFTALVMLRMPDGSTLCLNDGGRIYVARAMREALKLFPDDPVFRWAASGGREGKAPGFTSCAMPYSGAVVMRTSWDRDAVAVYLDASPFGAGHQHEDKLNLVMHGYGREMLVEAGNYAYDSSEMRKYVTSTRSHNTVRIDGLDQCTRRTWKWTPQMLEKKADLKFSTSPEVDRCEAAFEAGYARSGWEKLPGDDLVKVVHRRSVAFHKAPGAPWVEVEDVFEAPDDKVHAYEIIWHLAESKLAVGGNGFTADFGDGVELYASVSGDGIEQIVDMRGQKEPYFQGWLPIHKAGPHEHRPIPTPVVKGRFAKSAKVVTILRPLRKDNGTRKRPDVMAIYFPNWHVSPQLETYYGPGKSEWDFVKTSPTRFPGHRQPMIPVHGYLDGKNPADVAKEIDLAADAGIDVFLYDYYYYGGATILQEALDEGYLRAKNRDRVKFALMWCYHEFDNEFRQMPGAPHERMYSLAKTPYEFAGMVDLCLKRYFVQPQYYRRNGALYFSIYNPALMLRSLGADGLRRAIADARRKVQAAGLGEMHFNGQGGRIENTEEMKSLGFDSLTDYAFGVYVLNEYEERSGRGEWLYDFGAIGPELEAWWRRKADGPLPYYPLVPTGWDTSGRMRPDVKMPVGTVERKDPQTLQIVHATASYPYTGIYTNATAANFGRYLERAKRFAEEDLRRGLVQINAWNEYTEGCWLVPDNFEGDAKLREIERVFGRGN